MTLVLKSDQISSNSLGSITGINGPKDYSVLLDFNAGIYRRRNAEGSMVSASLSEAVTFNRSTPAMFMDRSGVWRVASTQEPRIHYMPDANMSGLLLEHGATNLFPSPNTPQNQVISLDHSAADSYVLSVWGPGSATMTGDITLRPGSPDSATQWNPVSGLTINPASGSPQVSVEITGYPTYVFLHKRFSLTYAHTPLPTGQTTVGGERASLSPLFAEAALSGGSEATILAHFETFTPGGTFGGDVGLVTVKDSSSQNTGIHVTRRVGTAAGVTATAVEGNNTSVKNTNQSFGSYESSVTVALAYGNGGQEMSVAPNTVLYKNDSEYNFNPDTVIFGSGGGFRGGAVAGIVTSLVAYPYKLSDEQLVQVSGSWL